MEGDKDAYYVVQKGDVFGFYRSLKELKAQAGRLIFDPNATIYKGYHLSKEAELYLASHGLQSATYSISAANVTKDLFGKLLACPYEQPFAPRGKMAEEYPKTKRQEQVPENPEYAYVGARVSAESPKQEIIWDHGFEAVPASSHGFVGANWVSADSPKQETILDHGFGAIPASLSHQPSVSRGKMAEDYSEAGRSQQAHETVQITYFLEFDGASKGNPGLAGAGAVLRANDGSTVCRLQEGVGVATNNVAEYRAVILGLKHALKIGIKHICVQGDSKLVCMQVQGLWKLKNQNMANLCKVAKELKDKFVSFEISHIPREQNSDADDLANRAIHLRDGVVVEDCKHK
ncbi:uncharacterized protein LOC120092011 isoform X1 [Benincasa hispida]|uniref:uncharacterized protein LOC120092011 isoform X1 n=1 Tax=Benincasa hispida TaxID=102211 RepID=UPI0019026A80|nr:uncharacterized protein LOC120092011 isoform X1 [Benincasa hispida]